MTRIGASQVFFNVVAQWNADKMIRDTKTQMTVMKAVVLDSFEAMLKPVDDFTNNLNMMTAEMSEASQEFGKAKVEFEKFFGSENLDMVSQQLVEIGENFAVVGSEALDAGSRASQVANLIGKQNVGLLVEQAQILSTISDLNAEEAQRGMIQLQQQTGLLTRDMNTTMFRNLSLREQEVVLLEQSAVMLDTLNTIANRSVAMEGDLVKTLSNFAAQGDLIGESFADMAAMSAVLLEAGEEQGASGRALRMMYARLGGNISGTRDKLEALGIATKDENGNLLTMRELMDGLVRDGYEKLNAEQKQNIAQIVSGNRHYVRFIKLMENHNRVVQLSADGMAGYDSATQQADKAMSSLTMQLEKQRTIQENLNAAMGTQMTPFMVGQLEAQNNLRMAYLDMMEVLPSLGKVFGKLMGSFEMFEGFLRFSIGLQSMAIGFEMMDSVQRSLHGILIANENLHSKQATYMASGVQASAEQNAIMNEIRYQSQLINTLQERMRNAKHEMIAIDQERLPLIESEGQRLATMVEQTELIGDKKREMERTEFVLKTLSDGRLNDSTRMMRILDSSVDHTKELAANFMAIDQGQIGMSIRTERFASQMLANAKVMNDLDDRQNMQIRARQEELRKEHTVLQMIKAENQAAFQLRANQNRPASEQVALVKELSFSQNDLNLAVEIFNEELEQSRERLARLEEQKVGTKLARGTLAARAEVNGLNEALTMMNEKLAGKGVAFNLGKVGSGVLTRLMSTRMGEMIEIQKIIDTMGTKEMSLGEIQKKRAIILDVLSQLEQENSVTKVGLNKIMKELVPLEDMYGYLQEEVAQAERDRVDVGQQKNRLIHAMRAGIEVLSDSEREAINVQSDFVKSQDNLRMSSKRMGMALGSAATIVMGAFGGRGATASAITSISMLAPAVATASKAIFNGKDGYLDNLIKMNAQQKNIPILQRAHIKELIRMGVVYGSLTGAMILYNHHKKEEKELTEDLIALNNQQLNVHNRLMTGADQMIIQNQELAELLGIQGITLRDMHKDESIRLRVVQSLTGEMKNFTGENRSAVTEALALAEAVGSLTEGMEALVAIQMTQSQLAARESEGSFFGLAGFLKDVPEAIGYMFGEDEVQQQHDQYVKMLETLGKDTRLNTSYAAYGGIGRDEYMRLTEEYFVEMAKMGKKLTDEEMAILSDRFDSPAMDAYFKGLNDAILATGDLALIEQHLGNEVEDTTLKIGGMTNEIQNLTDEIYQFSGAREELFFGGKHGNVTGSLYKQVVTQGVGTLYNKNEVIVSNNFHGFFNEQEAADRIISIVTQHLNTV